MSTKVYVLEAISTRLSDDEQRAKLPPPVDEISVYANKEAALAMMRIRYSDALCDIDEDELYDADLSTDGDVDGGEGIVGEAVIIYDSIGNEDRWTVFERAIKGV